MMKTPLALPRLASLSNLLTQLQSTPPHGSTFAAHHGAHWCSTSPLPLLSERTRSQWLVTLLSRKRQPSQRRALQRAGLWTLLRALQQVAQRKQRRVQQAARLLWRWRWAPPQNKLQAQPTLALSSRQCFRGCLSLHSQDCRCWSKSSNRHPSHHPLLFFLTSG